MAGQGKGSAARVSLALLVVSWAMAVQGMDHTVGGAQGWTRPDGNGIPDSYLSTWAKGETFSEGDNLIFNYGPSHNVFQVTQTDYTSCITTSPLNKWTTGKDTVKLAAGTSYFICATGGHCDAGQKVTIVAAGATPGSTSPTKNAASGNNFVPALQALVAATLALVATIALW